jgi:methylated-DNA-[protein]-cysteine S-methyltransferase
MSHPGETVYWSALQHGDWTLYLAATERGLCSLTLPNVTYESMAHWIAKHIPGAQLVEDTERTAPYRQQLSEYLDGRRVSFDCPLDLRGTPFQVATWRALLTIPYGETRSYSEIAAAIELPKAVRAVGAANGANPVPIIVPCHRVIGKNGALTGYGGGLPIKERLLQLERSSPNAR